MAVGWLVGSNYWNGNYVLSFSLSTHRHWLKKTYIQQHSTQISVHHHNLVLGPAPPPMGPIGKCWCRVCFGQWFCSFASRWPLVPSSSHRNRRTTIRMCVCLFKLPAFTQLVIIIITKEQKTAAIPLSSLKHSYNLPIVVLLCCVVVCPPIDGRDWRNLKPNRMFLPCRIADPTQRENLGIIVQYKVKVKLCIGGPILGG